jgi:2-keto-4-pentenoate hydratase/2-oxohepta-3-ene-1,7-dioic acid hydratase in catechol pathway
MYLARHEYENNPRYGLIKNKKFLILDNSFHIEKDKASLNNQIIDEINLCDVNFLPPCEPTKIIGIALNYKGVGKEKNIDEPLVFIKGLNSLALGDLQLNLPSPKAWGECELAAVIKHKVKNISIDDVTRNILGYMPANDITCQNFHSRDHHLARSKSADGFCPVGKSINLNYNYQNKKIQGFQNNILIREGNTSDMIFSIEKIVSWLSSWMTLNPGDIILSGAPPRVHEKQFLKSGDTYSVRVEGFDDLNIEIL